MNLITPISRSELHLIRDLARAIWPLVYSEMISKEQMDYMLNWMYDVELLQEKFDRGELFFTYLNEHKPIGYLHVEPVGNISLKIQKLYVHPEFHGQGIGRKFIDHARNIANEKKLPLLELQVNRNNPAVNFYKKLGFYVFEEKDFDIGQGYFMNDYVMRMTV
jgi:ribosomal protein S18 acetylase RimI-like enzyme